MHCSTRQPPAIQPAIQELTKEYLETEAVSPMSSLQDKVSGTRVEDYMHTAAELSTFGLGKGLSATIPHQWSHKSAVVTREISSDLTNLVITKETGEREYFQQMVPTWVACQREILRQLEQPKNLSLHFGTHLQFADNSESISVAKRFLTTKISFNDSSESSEYERQLGEFLCNQFCPNIEDQLAEGRNSPIEVLKDYISTLKRSGNKSYLQDITRACVEYIATTNITHYISGIELGRLQYDTYSTGQYIEMLGSGLGPIGGPLRLGAITSPGAKWMLDTINSIGRSGRGSGGQEGEEVIGFDVQPVHTLVKQEDLQGCLKNAVKAYIYENRTKEEGEYCCIIPAIQYACMTLYTQYELAMY